MKYYFDMETTGLNPHFEDAEILTTQFMDNDGNFKVFTRWELSEKDLIEKTQNFFVDINFRQRAYPTYNPIFTYNGGFDFHYLMGRIGYLFNEKEKRVLHNTMIRYSKHCDLLQFNNGYYVSLQKLVNKHNIKRKTNFMGSDIYELYKKQEYESIVNHAYDDVNILKQLVNNYGYGGRFL